MDCQVERANINDTLFRVRFEFVSNIIPGIVSEVNILILKYLLFKSGAVHKLRNLLSALFIAPRNPVIL